MEIEIIIFQFELIINVWTLFASFEYLCYESILILSGWPLKRWNIFI